MMRRTLFKVPRAHFILLRILILLLLLLLLPGPVYL
jgi:hypothetical protein